MADALISMLLEKLASTAYAYVEEEVKLVLNVKKEVEEFASNLKAIEVVVQDAEQRQVKEDSVQNWLDNLKEISYQMVDVLDEWNTDILRQQVENQEREGATAIVPKKKVSFSIVPRCLCLGQAGQIILRREIAVKIKSLNERLTVVYKQRKMYDFRITEKVIQKQQTSSFVDVSKIFGREKEKEILITKLLNDTSEEGKRLLIIPVVGMGGMGKTTLTQLAYHDANVKAHFQKRMWICVSDPFDEIMIAKAIIGDDSPSSNQLDHVLQCMSRSIEGKKFLLVLDDVWSEDPKKWDQLMLPLMQNGAEGSKILVTTRKKKVASMMRATTDMINLGELSEHNCLSIFNYMAFSNREVDESGVFGDISREIVKKCKGLPLAAKTLGSLMREKMTRRDWLDVLNSKLWDREEVEQEVFQPLLLSYYDLEPTTKCCFLYCAIFPKDYELKRDNLINLWMAQDYLDSKENKDKGKTGHSVFDNLVARSFFQDLEMDCDSGKIIGCKMHDIVHDFVQFLTKNECLITEAVGGRGTNELEVLSGKVRHLTLTSVDSVSILSSNLKNLRTLSTFGLRLMDREANFILQFKCLRTLNLGGHYIEELPERITGLIHLRHIDLSSNSLLEKLPDTICGLYNLYTLDLRYCYSLKKLPDNMGKMINLKHLYVEGCDGLEYLPKGIGRLTSLQTLDECLVFAGDNGEALQVGNLRTLNLRGSLTLKVFGDVTDGSEVEEARLWDNKQLFHLGLDFSRVRCGFEESSVGILNVLRPHEDLESLYINRNPCSTWPKWMMSLNNLRFLTLRNWNGCEILPPLGKLPFLERLTIRWMRSVVKVGGEFLGIEDDQTSWKSSSSLFPKLKLLNFIRMLSWKVWEGGKGLKKEDSEFTIMPCLSSLKFKHCDQLETLPDFLCKIPLQNLTISECPKLTEGCKEGGGEEWPKISHIPNIKLKNSGMIC